MILRRTNAVNYEVLRADGQGKSDVVHVVRMKPYHDREEELQEAGRVEEREMEEKNETVGRREKKKKKKAVQERTGGGEVHEKRTRKTEVVTTLQDPPPPGKRGRGRPRKDTTANQEVTAPPVGTTRQLRPRRNNEGNSRQVALVSCILLYLTSMATNSEAKPGDFIQRDGVLFVEKADVAFSESTWTTVMDLDLQPIAIAIEDLRKGIRRIQEQQPPHLEEAQGKNEKLRQHIRQLQNEKYIEAEERLQELARRLRVMSDSLKKGSKGKRAIMDGGGKILNWMFGVATAEEMEEVNAQIKKLKQGEIDLGTLMKKQVSLVNESLWLSKNTTTKISEMAKMLRNINGRLNGIADDLHQYLLVHLLAERMSHTVEESLIWLANIITDLEVGLGTMATGHLPTHLWPPTIMKEILDEVRKNLQPGWSLTMSRNEEEVWSVYRDARTSVAAVENKIRILAHIPIYDRQLFTVYKVHQLPKMLDNNRSGIMEPLAELLAVSHDAQSFVELNQEEARECGKDRRNTCQLHRGMLKRSTPGTCTSELFLGNTYRIKELCRKKIIPDEGPKTIYLGENRWIIANSRESETTIVCPVGTEQLKRQVIVVRENVVFKLPSGCEGHARHWWLPASFVGSSKEKMAAMNIPDTNIGLPDFWPNKGRAQESRPQPPGNDEILVIDNTIKKENQIAGQLDKWIHTFEQEKEENNYYPGEILGLATVALGISIIVGIFAYRYGKSFYERMTAHENGEIQTADEPTAGNENTN